MNDTRKYWFPARRYGWGWGLPTSWQGWVVIGAYLLAVAAIAWTFPPAHHMLAFQFGIWISTAILVLVCWLKGEPPRWRWGGE